LPGAHSFITQIAGNKLIILYSPADTSYIYPTSDAQFFISKIKSIDQASADTFPLFAKATRYDAELSPGDIVFMPNGWWHTAKMLSFSISLGLDVANSTNWKDIIAFMRRYYKGRRPIIGKFVLAYFHLIGLLMTGSDNKMRH
jgi:Cupin-like domain